MLPLTIGITDTEARYENYPLWMKRNHPDIHIIKLSSDNINELDNCDGVILSGGVDTHPSFYGNSRTDYPLAPEKFNIQRDEFELAVFKHTQQKNIPVLAICRGMQLVNIALGGDMLQDIEESGIQDHRRHGEVDGIHEISVVRGSLLHKITGRDKGIVNSAHHQALGKIAADLKVSGFSPDGIAEGAEWKNAAGKAFLLCVQWHPERLAQQQPNNPFTTTIRGQFLTAVKEFKTKKDNSKSK